MCLVLGCGFCGFSHSPLPTTRIDNGFIEIAILNPEKRSAL
jgi:hypothetical protein